MHRDSKNRHFQKHGVFSKTEKMRSMCLETQNFAFRGEIILLPCNFLNFCSHFQKKFPCFINWEKNQKTFFDFLSSRLGNNVSLFRLRQFGEVGAGLGSPVAGVEIGTG